MTYNFSSGPAMIPSEVMKEANQEFLDYSGSGMSVMELNHRSVLFNEIIDEAKADLKSCFFKEELLYNSQRFQ